MTGVQDDILSAVDASVSKNIFEHCFNRKAGSLLEGKTVLLVTHQLHVARQADIILSLEEGRLVEYGTPDELMKSSDGVFSRLVRAGEIVNLQQPNESDISNTQYNEGILGKRLLLPSFLS